MNKQFWLLLVSMFIYALLLQGCCEDGGCRVVLDEKDKKQMEQAKQYPVVDVFEKFYQTNKTYSLAFDYLNQKGTVLLQVEPKPAKTKRWHGMTLYRSDILTVSKNKNIFLDNSMVTQYFTKQPFRWIGLSDENTTYDILGQNGQLSKLGQLPQKAKVGNYGVMYTAQSYANPQKNMVDGIRTAIWQLEEARHQTAYLCEVMSVEYIKVNQKYLDDKRSLCLHINQKGDILGIKMTVHQGENELVLQSVDHHDQNP